MVTWTPLSLGCVIGSCRYDISISGDGAEVTCYLGWDKRIENLFKRQVQKISC